jgi:hypothetical protein
MLALLVAGRFNSHHPRYAALVRGALDMALGIFREDAQGACAESTPAAAPSSRLVARGARRVLAARPD